ncbi:MAG: PEP/pyruvate-binding domain-containing protein, partial [Bacteroidota bacterium]
VEPEKANEGIVNLAFGLGKQIVDGGVSLRFAPKHPERILQLASPELALKDTQKYFYALDLNPENFSPSTDDAVNLLKMRIKEAEKDGSLKQVSSTYDFENNMIREGTMYKGKKIITFANVLKHKVIPLDQIMQDLLEIGENEMSNPIEIEFAVDLNVKKSDPIVFNFLQIRPIVDTQEQNNIDISEIEPSQTIIYSDSALGNGLIDNIYDFVYVKPDNFSSLKSNEIAVQIAEINKKFIAEERNYVLVGPGRWGTADPSLGIPVKWGNISQARVIVESGLDHYRIDPSQGTHFFQNLTSFGVGYFTINPYIGDGFYDLKFLKQTEPEYENEFIKHIRFKKPIVVQINGKESKGVVLKPGQKD